jgi:hypothetical protein
MRGFFIGLKLAGWLKSTKPLLDKQLVFDVQVVGKHAVVTEQGRKRSPLCGCPT